MSPGSGSRSREGERDAGFSGGGYLVLISIAAADPDCAGDCSTTPQWNAAREDHHAPVVRCVDPKELPAGLTIFGELRGFYIEGARRERLVDRNIEAADPGAVHPDMAHQIPAGIDDGDVHRLTDFVRFGFCGGDHAPRITESNHDMSSDGSAQIHSFDAARRPVRAFPAKAGIHFCRGHRPSPV
jgi:hypothetical protein